MKIDISSLIGDLVEATVKSLKEDSDYEEFLGKKLVTRKYDDGKPDRKISIRGALQYAQDGQMDGNQSASYSQAIGLIDKEANKKNSGFDTEDLPDSVQDEIKKFKKQAQRAQDREDKKSTKDTDAADDEVSGSDAADAVKDTGPDDGSDKKDGDIPAPKVPEGPMSNDQIKEELKYLEEVTGKDKSLDKKANPIKSKQWTDTNIEPTPDEFKNWQNKSKRGRPEDQQIDMEQAAAGVSKPYRFPEKYMQVLGRMINTEGLSDPKGDSVSNFIDGAGAGMISSQAGEILTMMVTSIPNDKEAQTFADNIVEVLEKQKGTKQVLDKSWVKAAMENRKSTMEHVRSTYGDDAKITSGCWDLKSEVEAMGLSDYDKDKGYSTDAYFTVSTPQHDGDLLLEVSLKKDANVMFYNGGTGDLLKPKCVELSPRSPKGCAPMGWNTTQEDYADVERDGVTLKGDDYNPEKFKDNQNLVYRDNQKVLSDESNIKASIPNMNDKDRADLIKLLNDKTFQPPLSADTKIDEKNLENIGPQLISQIMGNYENQFDKDGNKIKAKPSFDTSRMNKMAMLVSKSGNDETKKVYDRMTSEHKQFQKNLAQGLLMNDKLRGGLMGILRDEFPIKAAAQGEEVMSIGDMVLDRKTCESLFGTADFNQIREGLSIDEDEKSNPIIVYSAQGTGDAIPLAAVDIRQKGIGYSGYPSFNLKVHKGFGKKLKASQTALKESLRALQKFLKSVIV